jgi:hypothetical protein
MAIKSVGRITDPVLNQTVSAGIIQSAPFSLRFMSGTQVAYLVNVGAGLTASFQLMVSMDGINYYNSGTILPGVTGSAYIFPVQSSVAFPWCLMQCTWISGSGSVLITGTGKGSC